ncbi:MAG TPA: TlpA family protein disulfide reductase [Campylobacterales bacterium]|nr:TlpA family protein disulfide reductase [Campylobacterales bacterium]HHS93515.1 TlpA family protein disulfide reductase [Campylobacterales bacterium]
MKKLFLTFTLILTTLVSASTSFSLSTIDNETINISELKISETESGLKFDEFKGKPVLLTLFGHRCPPCLKEIPEFIKITNKYKDLEIVAIESQLYPLTQLKEFVAEHGINYKVVAGTDHADFIDYIGRMAGYGKGIPLPLLIAVNKEGEVEHVQAGLIRADELEMLVKDLSD